MTIPDAAQLRTLAERYTAAWSSGDPLRVASCYSAGGSLTVNDDPPATGREAIIKVAQGFMTAFPDLDLTMDGLSSDRGRTVYRWTLRGTYSDTGKRVCISGYEEWSIGADGLIGESLGHFDRAEYQRQIR